MSIPHPNATGSTLRENPDVQLVPRSQAHQIVHATLGSRSNVDATGAFRDPTRAHMSQPTHRTLAGPSTRARSRPICMLARVQGEELTLLDGSLCINAFFEANNRVLPIVIGTVPLTRKMPTSRRQKPCLLTAGFIGRRLTKKSDMRITE